MDPSEADFYFDGDTPDTAEWAFAWTGTPHASTSTATYIAPFVLASLLTTDDPRPVQVIVVNLQAGTEYDITGHGPGDMVWSLPGGKGVSDGEPIRLIDKRAPVNVPVNYRVLWARQYYESVPLIVPWKPADAETNGLVQSLDGRISLPIAAWMDNGVPQAPEITSATFPVRDRRRPVMVLSTAGDGTTAVQWRLDRAASVQLRQILAAGGGVVVRTDGAVRDLPGTDLAVITAASSVLWGAVEGGRMSDARVWDLTLTWIDDPEPGTVSVVWTLDEVDTLLGDALGLTLDGVDAMFAGQTLDGVDAFDWGTLA